MLKRVIFFCMAFVFLGITHCMGETILTPSEYFYQKHPDLKQKYIHLSPTAFSNIVKSVSKESNAKIMVMQTIKQRFPDIPDDLMEFLNDWEKNETESFDRIMHAYNKFEKSLTEDDYLYFFDYEDNKVKQSGLLVLNNGDIKYREVYVEIYKEDKE